MMRPKARGCHATHMMASCRDWNMATAYSQHLFGGGNGMGV